MIPPRVQQILEANGLYALEFEPGSTPTSEMAAEKIGVEVAQIAKSILMAGKDGAFRLAIMRGDRKIHSTKLKKATGVKHRMASAEETEEQAGFRVGAVCPFGLDGIEIYIDQGLADYETVYPAAGTDASGVPMTFEALVSITGGRVVDIAQD